MHEELISFKVAVLAKEKGFDIKCKNWYDQTGTLEPFKGIRGAMCYTNVGYASTQALLQKWLREVHFIIVEPKYNYTFNYWNLLIYTPQRETVIWHFPKEAVYSTYEEALEEGLLEGLKLI